MLPGRTPSKSGEAILIPAAAITSSTGLNLSRGSRISSSGFGSKSAFGFITITESRFATTTESPFFIWPSMSIMLAVVPRPTSSFTSRIIPRFCFSSWDNLFCMYCCVRPTSTVSSSGIPTPVRALTGTIDTSFPKSFTL